jgi:hypothetical protein
MDQLRLEAYGLMARLFVAMLNNPGDARLTRLNRLHHRAERRYWRRYEQAYPPGNQTPAWFYRDAKGGY